MPTTYVDYPATAAQTDFAFTFPYLEDEHVIVEIDGVQKTLTTDYTIVTSPSTKIVLTSGATAGQIVRVRRKSQPGIDLVDFENGSVLTESELDRAYQHNRYLNEEISELNDASLQKEAGGTDWDAGGSKIKNVGTPTLTADATTKQYVDDKVNQISSGASAPPTKWVFTGDAGANTTYSVTGAEVNGDTAYDVSIDGSVLEPTTDYTVDPDTDTLTIVNTLSGGEDIVVIERGFGVAITGTIGEDQLQNNAVTNGKLADHSVTAVKISNTDPIFNVQTTGEVGIGTASPSAKLEVNSGVNDSCLHLKSTDPFVDLKMSDDTTTDGGIRVSNKGDDLLLQRVGGNVGIGTEDPSAKLEVVETSSGVQFEVRGTSSVGGKFQVANAGGDLYVNLRAAGSSDDAIKLDTNGPSFFNGGNVGIGTETPSAPLEVSSTAGGIVFPRLTTIQRDAISTPTDGETIFNTTNNQLESYNGSDWVVVGSGAVSKYSTGWQNSIDAVTVANGSTHTITHNLGTDDVTVQVFVATSSAGANSYLIANSGEFGSSGSIGYNAQINTLSTNTFELQLGSGGYFEITTSGTINTGNAISFASKYIKVVVIG